MVFGKPLLLRKSHERPSRLTHDLSFMMGKNTVPAAVSTAIFGHHLKIKLAYLTVLPIAGTSFKSHQVYCQSLSCPGLWNVLTEPSSWPPLSSLPTIAKMTTTTTIKMIKSPKPFKVKNMACTFSGCKFTNCIHSFNRLQPYNHNLAIRIAYLCIKNRHNGNHNLHSVYCLCPY